MPANTLWHIEFGAYALTVDRKTLTYRLVETETGTVWAENLSLGAVEIEERASGIKTWHSFGACKLISLSEKAGAQGKRILFGLDAPGGIPVDVYLTCTEREIQLTVEASRDTKTHRAGAVRLLNGLCRVPDDAASYLVLPIGTGAILFAKNAPDAPVSLPVWDAQRGLTMPFVGAVRGKSALALLTDSAYAAADVSVPTVEWEPRAVTADLRYERDPERRRLDVRIALIPNGDHISIARAYRDKVIGDGGHVTLRKKLRENPAVDALIGRPFSEESYPVGEYGLPPIDSAAPPADRWEQMEDRIAAMRQAAASGAVVGSLGAEDWSAAYLHFWHDKGTKLSQVLHRLPGETTWSLGFPCAAVPLLPVVYHDSVVCVHDINSSDDGNQDFLQALLHLATPDKTSLTFLAEYCGGGMVTALCAVLFPLARLSFAAFLTAHRFLTPDFAAEEARYSNGVHIIINRSYTDDYITDDLHLPPLGFYVAHPEMTAHNARRVGARTFDTGAWQVRRSLDDGLFAGAGEVLEETFPV